MADWEDPRAVFMSGWVLNSLKAKSDKWKKMVNIEECKYDHLHASPHLYATNR
jgi:hypothetical protein